MTTYRIIIDVQGSTLATLLALIEGNADIKLRSVSDAHDPALPPSPMPPARTSVPSNGSNGAAASRFVGGRKNKGIGGAALVEELLQSGPASLTEIRNTFTHRGFSSNSAPPCISRLMRDGRLTRTHGRYALVKP